MRSSRRRGLVMSGVLTMTILGMAVAPVGAATASYCGITWGSTAKSGSGGSVGYVSAVRAGRHDCFDRLVFEGTAAFNVVEYVSQVTTDGAGDPVPLAGGAFLQVGLLVPGDSPRYSGPMPNVSGFPTLRQAKEAGTFEGYESFGVGVRTRLPFRVFVLSSPPRVVLDVAHYW